MQPSSRVRQANRPVVASLRAWGAIIVLAACTAADWPQWRGPGRDGHAADVTLPANWSAETLRVVWRAKVGTGYSSPVIAGGRLYLHTREAGDEVVLCLDADTGSEIWRDRYAAPYQVHPAATQHGPGPKATTTLADGKVYAYGISSILTCLDAETGRRIWQRDLKEDFDAEPAEYGTAGSPLVEAGRVVVPVGGKRGGAVMAFNQDTGELLWKAFPDERPAMGSPIAAPIVVRSLRERNPARGASRPHAAPRVQQIIAFTEKHLVGLDPEIGRTLWKHPFATSYRQNIVTPVVMGDLVIASGTGQPGFALRIDQRDNRVVATQAWSNPSLQLYMSSPVAVGHYVYGANWRGELVCVNARDGSTNWAKAGFGEYASIVVAGDQLLVLDVSGTLTVVAADPALYRELGRSKLTDAETWSHLAVAGHRLYVRDLQEVRCFSISK